MSPKIICFRPQVDRWLSRHRWVNANKIIGIVRGKEGNIHYNVDGSYVLSTGVINNGKPVMLFIKVREIPEKHLIFVQVIKIHAGHLSKIEDF